MLCWEIAVLWYDKGVHLEREDWKSNGGPDHSGPSQPNLHFVLYCEFNGS